MTTQTKPIHKTFHYTLTMGNGKPYSKTYKCSSMVSLLEHVRYELEGYNVKAWRIDKVVHNY